MEHQNKNLPKYIYPSIQWSFLLLHNVYPATSALLSVPSVTSQATSELGRSSGEPQLTLHRRGPHRDHLSDQYNTSVPRHSSPFSTSFFISIAWYAPRLKPDTAVSGLLNPRMSLSLSLIPYGPSGVIMLTQQGAGEQNKLRPLNSIVFTMVNQAEIQKWLPTIQPNQAHAHIGRASECVPPL